MSEYTKILKKENSKEIKMAVPRSEVQKSQNNRCYKCKKDLRSGFFTLIHDPKTQEKHIICSDCLVEIKKKN